MARPASPQAEPEDFRLLTSMRGVAAPIGGNEDRARSWRAHFSDIYMHEWHRQRLVAAARAFDWPPAAVKYLVDNASDPLWGFYDATGTVHSPSHPTGEEDMKIRLVLSRSGSLSVGCTPIPKVPDHALHPPSLAYPPPGQPSWSFYVAAAATTPSLFTKHKTTRRAAYDEARMGLPPPEDAEVTPEVLLFNERDEIMEGSISTPYFWRGGEWVTPHEWCGGNRGVSRRLALERGLAREGIVPREGVEVGEKVWCSNAVRGFGWGVVQGVGKGEEGGEGKR